MTRRRIKEITARKAATHPGPLWVYIRGEYVRAVNVARWAKEYHMVLLDGRDIPIRATRTFWTGLPHD